MLNGFGLIEIFTDPIIFRGLKALTLADTQQQSLLRLALEGISVYSPHTAVDAAPGGLGDWLADIVTGTLPGPEPETHTGDLSQEEIHPKPMTPSAENRSIKSKASTLKSAAPSQNQENGSQSGSSKPKRPTDTLQRNYSKPTYPSYSPVSETPLAPAALPHTRTVIQPLTASPPQIPENSGMGRLIRFETPQPLTHLIERIARGVGTPKGFPVAIPQTKQVEDIEIRSIGIAAGSGHSILADVDADLLFTGELSHHEALRVTEQGRCVVTLFHSNTERGYLSSVMKGKLEDTLREEWEKVRTEAGAELEAEQEEKQNGGEGKQGEGQTEGWADAVRDESVLVEVSEQDRDPFGIVILQSSEQVGQPIS